MLALAEANNLRSVYLSVRDDEVPAATTHRDLSLRLAMFTPIMELGDRIAAVERSLGDGGQPDELRATALLVLAELYFNSGGGQAGVDAGTAAAELFEGLGDRRLQTWARYAVAINLWGHVEDAEVLALAPPVIEEFRAQREPTGLAYALWMASQVDPDPSRAVALARNRKPSCERLTGPLGSPIVSKAKLDST